MPDPVPAPSDRPLPFDADREAAAATIDAASARVQADLERASAATSGTVSDILGVTAAMAADPTLVQGARRLVVDDGESPARAVWDTAGEIAERLRSLGGDLAERARDVADVRDRIVAVLTDAPVPGIPVREEPSVLVAHDLAPADAALLDPEVVVALVTSGGGPTSHTAILARSLGIPCVVATRGADDLADGELVAVDGATGEVVRDPDEAAVARANRVVDRPTTLRSPGATSDGHPVELLANVGDPSGASAAARAGAQGVGLFRTEFCFLGRTSAPGIDEQVSAYRTVLAAFAGRKVVVRTLDAGADKPLPFVTAPHEPNPALGVRGLRTAAVHPQVLEDQLAAIAQAAAAESAEVWVMAPMVATPDEAEAFVARCAEHGLATAGVMVEVPAAALRARHVLAHAAFASIGTNDLTQYALAADRELAGVAELSTPWQPAVLDLVDATCRGGGANARPVGVCGEAAADPALATVLVGLGVSSLSMTPRALVDVGAVLAATSLDECRALAALALAQPTATAARDAVRARLPVLEELGL
nr:phosphoenolpyruvate--protein phosphotransferase [Cellulomonas sp. PhB143]